MVASDIEPIDNAHECSAGRMSDAGLALGFHGGTDPALSAGLLLRSTSGFGSRGRGVHLRKRCPARVGARQVSRSFVTGSVLRIDEAPLPTRRTTAPHASRRLCEAELRRV